MDISEKIRVILKAKKMSITSFAELIDKPYRTVYNTLAKDGTETEDGNIRSMKYTTVEEWLDAIGVDIVLRDRETGEEFFSE